MNETDPADFRRISDWEDQVATTALFLPLMDLLERFTQYCFRRDLTFFVDSGTLLGVVRHRAVIPWDYDVDLGMRRAQYDRLVSEFGDPPGLCLDPDAYGEPDAAMCVVPPAPRSDDAPYLDLVAYETDGRSTMTEALQRRWPLDHWRTEHASRSWCYDFPPSDLDNLVALPTWCGLMAAPGRWQDRLNRHYDSWHAHPESIERAMRDLPFDPMVPAVRLAPSYRSLEQGLHDTEGVRPFVARNCAGFSLDGGRLEEALGREPSPLRAYVFEGPREEDQSFPMVDPRDALTRLRAGTLDVNITESEVTTLSPSVLPDALRATLDPADDFAFSYIMTARGTDTPFHWDRREGGGYLYLTEGEKYWMFMREGDAFQESLWGRTMTDILSADGFRHWGRVEVIHQRAGDLVVFPVGWCHRVLTYRASLGVGGYLGPGS